MVQMAVRVFSTTSRFIYILPILSIIFVLNSKEGLTDLRLHYGNDLRRDRQAQLERSLLSIYVKGF